MFERTQVDNGPQLHKVNVEMQLDDGRALTGRIAIPRSRSLLDALNSDSRCFLDFEPFEGEPQFIAKVALRAIRLLQAPKPSPLNANPGPAAGFDPHAILGVPKGADSDALRRAFLERSKAYHPDRFASVDLPDEVTAYLQAMARRVNMAYEALQAGAAAVEPVRSEPVWQSR